MSLAYGNFTWWGFSPALNLVQELTKHEVEYDTKEEINILLVGASDGRHILQTISKGLKQKVNFYVIENNLEAIARQMLFLSIFLQPLKELSVQEKVELFLELFGNTLIRPQTDSYLRQKSKDFIEWVTDSNILSLPLLNFSNLRFKERDALESIFKFWCSEDYFDISYHWEERLRKLLGVRYDSREGVYDWDYSMKLKEKAKIIHWTEYKYWRECGVAFRKREDSSYEVPNKTLASGLMLSKDGEKYPMRGYWGDIIASPFISFGIDSDVKSLIEKKNGSYTKTSNDVSYFNVTALIHELYTGVAYENIKDLDGVIIEELDEESDETVNEEKQANPNVTINPLSLNCIHELHKKSKFKSKFDIIFLSNSMVHNLNDTLKPLFAENGLLIIESTMFMIDLKDELHAEYKKKITSMASSAGCREITNFDPENDKYAYFKVQ